MGVTVVVGNLVDMVRQGEMRGDQTPKRESAAESGPSFKSYNTRPGREFVNTASEECLEPATPGQRQICAEDLGVAADSRLLIPAGDNKVGHRERTREVEN